MKKQLIGLALIVVFLFAGCTNFQIAADIGSEWESTAPAMQITIVNGNLGIGTLQMDDESIPIQCFIGPSKTGFDVFINDEASDHLDGDAWLFKGNYTYDEEERTITIDLYGDQIGLDVQQIVLHEKTDN